MAHQLSFDISQVISEQRRRGPVSVYDSMLPRTGLSGFMTGIAQYNKGSGMTSFVLKLHNYKMSCYKNEFTEEFFIKNLMSLPAADYSAHITGEPVTFSGVEHG